MLDRLFAPPSLRSRLSLVIVASMLGLLVLSIVAIGWSRGQGARHLLNDHVAADLALVHGRLASAAPMQRASMLPALERAAYRWHVVPRGLPLPEADDALLQELARRVVLKAAATHAQAVRWHDAATLRLALDAEHDLLVEWVGPLPASTPPPAYALAYLAAVTLVVAGVAWSAVSRVTRPLADASRAARAVARNLDAAPLREDGPAELSELARALNGLQSEVRRQLQSRTQILAAVSHDLKTPITRLRLRVAALPEGEARRRLEDDLDHMAALVDEGLAYARSERLHEERAAVDLNALLENIAEEAVDTGQDCRYEPRILVPVHAAPRALMRAVQNLVDNAIRYGGSAEIDAEPIGAEVEVRVADRGPELPGVDLERLFEPFVRGETSRGRDTGGTGLGLAIARNIAQSHGGRLWLERRDGGGLVARLRLPAAPTIGA